MQFGRAGRRERGARHAVAVHGVDARPQLARTQLEVALRLGAAPAPGLFEGSDPNALLAEAQRTFRELRTPEV